MAIIICVIIYKDHYNRIKPIIKKQKDSKLRNSKNLCLTRMLSPRTIYPVITPHTKYH